MSNSTRNAASAVANININGVILSPDGLQELRNLQDDENEGLEAHLEGLGKVTSFLLELADQVPDGYEKSMLEACKSLNYVRTSLLFLRSPQNREELYG